MKIEKSFALHEFKKEESFLEEMATDGYCLKDVLGNQYEFVECDNHQAIYKVVYSLSDYDESLFEGFQLVSTFSSTKGGHYYYLIQIDPSATVPKNDDRNYALRNQLSRIERFNGIIIASLGVLFLYLYITYKNPIYFIIIIGVLALGGYVLRLRKEIRENITD